MTYKLTLEYDGTDFHGSQAQAAAKGRTVQGTVEAALARLAGEPVRIALAGRTDAGVHARGQVASLEAPRHLPLSAWAAGLNAHLPLEIACVRAEEAPPGFDARRTSIFVSNHVNLFDPFVLYGSVPQFMRGLELESHFRIPVYGWMMRRYPVER